MTDQALPHRPASTKTALVTGASRGLGAALAMGLAKRGWHVIATARTVGALEALDDEIQAAGGQATLAPFDLSQPETVQAFASDLAQRFGQIDLWLHTAIHATPLTPADHIAAKDWAKALDINATATAQLIGVIGPLLARPDGQAVFFDDPQRHDRFMGSYGASKAAQMALVKSWATETAKIGPKVSIETPAPMPTALRARFYPGENRDALTPCSAEAERILAKILG